MLMVRNLTAGYGRSAVLHSVSFTVESESVTAILGAGGAGKTTLANSICGIQEIATGQVNYGGEDITHIPSRKRIGLGISYVPAGLRVFSELSVVDNLRLGTMSDSRGNFRDAADFVLALFPQLQTFLNSPAASLSPSLQRGVMVARAVISVPRLLVLDQPSFGLDGEGVHDMFQVLSAVNREYRTTILLMEQKTFQALKLAKTALLLERGRITADYSALELMANRTMQADFLGGARSLQERAA